MITPLHDGLLDLPTLRQLFDIVLRLGMATLLGGVVGFEREQVGKAAGLRTHMMVGLAAALFTVAPLDAGMSVADLSRVLQGIAAGIGFIGAGTILKLTGEQEIKGLTTAASLWLTAAVGMAVGIGHLWLPIVAVALAVIILAGLGAVERRMTARKWLADASLHSKRDNRVDPDGT
jgi:putative Mg2+ transporter-C (MgtC) family protein